jgi:hypothetical protein
VKTPVAFLIFNRPEATERVFEAIRLARPAKLLVVADGPRPDRPGEMETCMLTRAIIERVDWPCEILKNFSAVNLGCKKRISSGLDWVFDNVEEAIVLEDDCLPHPSFFRFCEENIERYRHDQRVMMISGDNFQFGRQKTSHSYYFSSYAHIWGWATWRRAWRHYDVDMNLWPEIKEGGWLDTLFERRAVATFWLNNFDAVSRGEIDTWDYQWAFALFVNSGLSILPSVNLISNIGFGADATRTSKVNKYANIPRMEMLFPLQHPPFVIRDRMADTFTEDEQFVHYPFLLRKLRRLLRIVR